MPPSLLLKMNPSAEWVIQRMKNTQWRPQPNMAEACLFQVVPGYHAAMTVKDSGVTYSEAGKIAAVVKNYESFAAGAFLQWLDDDANFTNPPSWLNLDIMGRNALGEKSLLAAKETGGKGKFYQEGKDSLWRTTFAEPSCAIRNDWNPVWDRLHNPDGSVKSGEQDEDIMEALHADIWRRELKRKQVASATTSRAKKAKKAAEAAGKQGAGGAGIAKGQEKAPVITDADAAAAAEAEAAAATIALATPMPVNYVHKYSLLFALLGRPAGTANEHSQLAMSASSGPMEDPVEDDDSDGSLKSPATIRSLKKEGRKGAGLPVSRGEKRKEKALDNKRAKREKTRENAAAIGDRLLDLLDNPASKKVDAAFEGYVQQLMEFDRQDNIEKRRRAKVDLLRDQINLYKDMGKDEEVRQKREELAKLFESPLPEPGMLELFPPPKIATCPGPGRAVNNAAPEDLVDLADSYDDGGVESGEESSIPRWVESGGVATNMRREAEEWAEVAPSRVGNVKDSNGSTKTPVCLLRGPGVARDISSGLSCTPPTSALSPRLARAAPSSSVGQAEAGTHSSLNDMSSAASDTLLKQAEEKAAAFTAASRLAGGRVSGDIVSVAGARGGGSSSSGSRG